MQDDTTDNQPWLSIIMGIVTLTFHFSLVCGSYWRSKSGRDMACCTLSSWLALWGSFITFAVVGITLMVLATLANIGHLDHLRQFVLGLRSAVIVDLIVVEDSRIYFGKYITLTLV